MLTELWKEKNLGWRPTVAMTKANAGKPGQPLAAAWNSNGDVLEVFWVDQAGAVFSSQKKPLDKDWEAPARLTTAGAAAPDSPLTAVWQESGSEMLVYWVANNGMIRGLMQRGGSWKQLGYVTPESVAPTATRLQSLWNPAIGAVEIFWAATSAKVIEAVKPWNQEHTSQTLALTPQGEVTPGAPLVALWEPFDASAEVYWSRTDGSIRGVRRTSTGWSTPYSSANTGTTEPSAPIAAVSEPVSGAVHVYWSQQDGSISQVTRLPANIYGSCPPAGCWSAAQSVNGAKAAEPYAPIIGLWESAYRQYEIFGVAFDGSTVRAVANRELPSEVTSAWNGSFNQMQTLWVASDRSVRVSWKSGTPELTDADQLVWQTWREPVSLAQPFLSVRGAPIRSVWLPDRKEFFAFATDNEGKIAALWRDFGTVDASSGVRGPWLAGPTGGNGAVGAAIAPLWYTPRSELMIFWSDKDGTIRTLSNRREHDGSEHWLGSTAASVLTGEGAAPPGAPLAAIFQGTRIDLFWITTEGAIATVWRSANGPWSPVVNLTAPGKAVPGSPLAASWDPAAWSGQRAEMVSWVDTTGALNSLTRIENQTAWTSSLFHRLGQFPPGVPMASLYLPDGAGLAWTDTDGSTRTFHRAFGKEWQDVSSPQIKNGLSEFGAGLGAAFDPVSKRIELIGVDSVGAVRTAWRKFPGDWRPYATNELYQIALARGAQPINTAQCIKYMANDIGTHNDLKWTVCSDSLGLTDYCAKQDAWPTAEYAAIENPDHTTTQRWVAICVPNSHPLSIGQQVVKITDGMKNGLLTALPYIALAVQAAACVDAQVYACVSVATQVAAFAGASSKVQQDVGTAIQIANNIYQCAGGDVVQCAVIGVKSAAAATKIAIPGVSPDLVSALATSCADGDFGACARLGAYAAAVAGEPVELAKLAKIANLATADYQACLDGDASACILLGKQAAAVSGSVPLQKLAGGVGLATACSDPQDTTGACASLGQEMAEAAGLPTIPFKMETIQEAYDCVHNKNSCQQLGQEVAQRGFPIVGIPKGVEIAAQCLNNVSGTCETLGNEVAPIISN